MAETKRSELIRQQLQKLIDSVPAPVTQAEREKIMSKRKGQADIDAGRAAIKAREEEVRLHNEQIERLTKTLGEAENQEGTQSQKTKREEGASPLGNKIVPGLIGAAGGSGITYGLNKIVKGGDKATAEALIEIGDEIGPTENLTNSQMNRSRAVGAADAAKQFAPTSALAKALDLTKRVGTYAVPVGVLEYERRQYQKQADDENLPWEERQAAQRMANGFLGGLSGIGLEGTARFLNKKVEPGVGRAMMRINTARDYARRMDERDLRPTVANASALTEEMAAPRSKLAQALAGKTIDAEVIPEAAPKPALPAPAASAPETTPAAKSPNAGTATYMRDQLKQFGVKGTSKMTKSQLAEALVKQMQEHGGKRTILPKGSGKAAIPLAVGTYMAGIGDAEAKDATPLGRATNAAENFGIGAGAAYGGSRLMQALSNAAPATMRAMGGGFAATTPQMAADMTDYSTEDVNTMRNWMVRNLPSALQFGGVREAAEMSQVPERREGPPPPSLMSAASLEIPKDIPAGVTEQANIDASMRPEPAAPMFPAAIDGRVKRMLAGGASPQQIATFLNGVYAQ